MSTRQLHYFVKVAEFRSFTRAAAVLHMAQPALSRSIRALEDDLGVALFHRSGRGVALTESGELLLRRGAALLVEFARVRDEVSAPATLRGELTFGMPPSMQRTLTVPLIRAYRAQHPGVQLRFIEGISATLSEGLLTGRIDMAVVAANEPIASLRREALLSESMLLVAPRRARLRLDRPVPIDRVAESALIVTPRPNALRALVETALAARGHALVPMLEANATSVMLEMVAAGEGCSVLPYCAVHQALVERRVGAAPIVDLRIDWTVAHSRERTLSRAASELARLLRRLAQASIARGDWTSARLSGSDAHETGSG